MTLSANAPLRQLLLDIRHDHGDYQQLQLALEQQFSAALGHDAAALAYHADRIGTLVEKLQERRQRRGWLAAQLAPPTGSQRLSLTAIFATLPEAARQACQAQWQALQAMAASCKTLNERNGQLLLNQRECYERVLFGESDIYAAP